MRMGGRGVDLGKLKGRDHPENTGLEGIIILKRILKRM